MVEQNATPIELAVLDLAGTTVTDDGLVEAAVRAVTGSWFDATAFTAHRGASKRDMLAAMLGSTQVDAALAEFDTALIEAVRGGRIAPLPHAQDTLRGLHSLGVRTCLLTGFSDAVRRALIESLGWQTLVDLSLSPSGAMRGRPWPDLILHAAVSAQVSSVAAVAVAGDTSNDVRAALRAGAGIVAAVLTGAHDRSTLAAARPTHVLSHVGELLPVVAARASTA